MPQFRLKRVYLPPAPEDGVRVLVDRLWPRGLAKERAKVDLWVREIAPSDALRRAFDHRAEHWADFAAAYARELESRHEPLDKLLALAAGSPVTLLFAARDDVRNNAVVLRSVLEARGRAGSGD